MIMEDIYERAYEKVGALETHFNLGHSKYVMFLNDKLNREDFIRKSLMHGTFCKGSYIYGQIIVCKGSYD